MSARRGPGRPQAESVRLPGDSDGYARRECAACHRLFKTRTSPREGALILRRVMRRVRHANADEPPPLSSATRVCPYCGADAVRLRSFTGSCDIRISEDGWALTDGPCDTSDERFACSACGHEVDHRFIFVPDASPSDPPPPPQTEGPA